MRPKKVDQTANKYGPFVALVGPICASVIYYRLGLDKTYGVFPITQVLYSLPIALFIWGISALVDDPAPGHEKAWAENHQIDYRTVSAFIACMIFGSTVFTAAGIMFGIGK